MTGLLRWRVLEPHISRWRAGATLTITQPATTGVPDGGGWATREPVGEPDVTVDLPTNATMRPPLRLGIAYLLELVGPGATYRVQGVTKTGELNRLRTGFKSIALVSTLHHVERTPTGSPCSGRA